MSVTSCCREWQIHWTAAYVHCERAPERATWIGTVQRALLDTVRWVNDSKISTPRFVSRFLLDLSMFGLLAVYLGTEIGLCLQITRERALGRVDQQLNCQRWTQMSAELDSCYRGED